MSIRPNWRNSEFARFRSVSVNRFSNHQRAAARTTLCPPGTFAVETRGGCGDTWLLWEILAAFETPAADRETRSCGSYPPLAWGSSGPGIDRHRHRGQPGSSEIANTRLRSWISDRPLFPLAADG